MRLKLFACFLCIIFLAGCRKDELIIPDPPPVTILQPPIVSKLTIASILQSNMVIQRDKPFKVWGTGTAASTLNITASWKTGVISTVTNSSGVWEAIIPASVANSTPQTISVAMGTDQPLKLENLLIGDVWICSGQSNMVMPVDVLLPSFKGVENYQGEIAAANHPLIRSLTIKTDYKNNPSDTLLSVPQWVTCSPETVGDLSAVAYFFALKLHTDLNVPIGIIVSAVNGTLCEEWTDRDAISGDPVLNSLFGNATYSSRLFNGMINPLKNISVKGFIWYQGENNQSISPADNYTKLNGALIKGWRSIFNQGELPFYYVQMTPFDYSATGNTTLNGYAKFREAQANIRSLVSGTGMVVTMDVGDLSTHHSIYKRPVGERLALLALNNTYGQNVQSVGAQYSSFTQTSSTVTVSFIAGTASGLKTDGNPLKQYFYVAGSDKVFRMGTASISGDKINITIPSGTPLPVQAVRYAFTNFPITNLQNSAGLPMEPFRTDNWSN